MYTIDALRQVFFENEATMELVVACTSRHGVTRDEDVNLKIVHVLKYMDEMAKKTQKGNDARTYRFRFSFEQDKDDTYVVWSDMSLLRIGMSDLLTQPNVRTLYETLKKAENGNYSHQDADLRRSKRSRLWRKKTEKKDVQDQSITSMTVSISRLKTLSIRMHFLLRSPDWGFSYISHLAITSQDTYMQRLHAMVRERVCPSPIMQSLVANAPLSAKDAMETCASVIQILPMKKKQRIWVLFAQTCIEIQLTGNRRFLSAWFQIQRDTGVLMSNIWTPLTELAYAHTYEKRSTNKNIGRLTIYDTDMKNGVAMHCLYDLHQFRMLLMLFIFNGMWQKEKCCKKGIPQCITDIWDDIF